MIPAGRGPLAIALVAEACLQAIAPSGTGLSEARAAVAAIHAWQRGDPLDPAQMADLLYSARDEGVLRYEVRSQGTPEHPLWLVLSCALAFATWHAAGMRGAPIPPEVAEVTSETLDDTIAAWRTVPDRRQLTAAAGAALKVDAGDLALVEALSR